MEKSLTIINIAIEHQKEKALAEVMRRWLSEQSQNESDLSRIGKNLFDSVIDYLESIAEQGEDNVHERYYNVWIEYGALGAETEIENFYTRELQNLNNNAALHELFE